MDENEQPLDNEGQANESQQETQQQEPAGHPAWQEILDVLPDDLHSLVKPTLEKWDRGVQDKVQSLHQKYDPYKTIIENGYDPNRIEQSLGLVQRLETDPEAVIQQAIEAFGLDYVKAAAAAAAEAAESSEDDYFAPEADTVLNDPRFKAMQEAVTNLQSRFEAEEQEQQSEAQAKAFEQQLEVLEQSHGKFDRLYVTALMSNGVDGAAAVKQYQDTINQAAAQLANQQKQQQTPPPVVMGADGTTGSGLPEKHVQFGSMKNAEVNDLVVQMLNQTS